MTNAHPAKKIKSLSSVLDTFSSQFVIQLSVKIHNRLNIIQLLTGNYDTSATDELSICVILLLKIVQN